MVNCTERHGLAFYATPRLPEACLPAQIKSNNYNPENTRKLLFRKVERVMGIEPTFEAWEAPVLPLNYTRLTAEVREFTTDDSR